MSTGRPTMGLAEFKRLPRYTAIASCCGPRNAAMQRARDVRAGSAAVSRMTMAQQRELSAAVRMLPIT